MPGGFLPVLQVVVEPRYAASDEQGVVVRSVAAVVLLPLCVITVEKELPGVSTAGIDVIPESYFRRDMVFENRIPDDTRDLMIIEEPEPAPEPFDWGFCSESSILQGCLRRWDGPYATSCGLCE